MSVRKHDLAAGPIVLPLAALALALPIALALGRSAVIALFGLAALPVMAVALARPKVALLLLVATGPIESSIQLSANPQLTVVKLAGALSFLSFAFDAIAHRRRLRFDVAHGVLFALLGVALVSTLGARLSGDALATTLRYASFVGLYYVATQFRSDDRLATSIAWVLSGSCSIASVLALRAYFSGATPLVTPAYGDPNDLAFMLATTLPLTLWLLRFPGWRRVVTLAMSTALIVGVLLSLSRGALLALGVAVIWHGLTQRRHIPVLVAGGLLTLAVTLVVVSGDAAARVDDTVRAKSNIAAFNVETRLDAWKAAVELTSEHPVVGVGPGNFGFYYFEKSGRPPGTFGLRVVHDAYLDVAAELGLTGLVLFLSFLAIVFVRASAARRARHGPPGLAVAVRTGLVVAAVASLTLSEQYFPPFWVLGALATMVGRDASDRTTGLEEDSVSRRAGPIAVR